LPRGKKEVSREDAKKNQEDGLMEKRCESILWDWRFFLFGFLRVFP